MHEMLYPMVWLYFNGVMSKMYSVSTFDFRNGVMVLGCGVNLESASVVHYAVGKTEHY